MRKVFLLIIPLFAGILSSQAQVTKCPDNHHPHAVDLGVGVKWACCNVSARSPEGAGQFFAWGETREKYDFSENEYAFFRVDASCDDIGYSIQGTEYDVATKVFGNNWRMPELNDVKRLYEKCKKTVIRLNGVPGLKFTGPNGNSIFLPFGGGYVNKQHRGEFKYGEYWTASVFDKPRSWHAWSFTISEVTATSSPQEFYGDFRHYGHMIRPIYK